MGRLSITVKGDGIAKLAAATQILGSGRIAAIGARALNHTGGKARTQVRRALTKQTGLKRKTIVRAVKVERASPLTLRYSMTARGGDVALKYFGARETRRGVSAAPFGKRTIFGGTFVKGGRFPSRKDLGLGGHVFERVGGSRFPIAKRKSGVVIPAEMVKGATRGAFETTVASELPGRVAHELRRATKGVMS